MNIVNKLATTVAAGAAAFLISKVIDTGWKKVTGEEPPTEDDDKGLLSLVVFAAVSAAAVALAQRYAVRETNRFLASHHIGE